VNQSKLIPIEPGAHQDCILAEGDVITVRAGRLLLARAEHRPGDEQWRPLERHEGHATNRAGRWILLNGASTTALVSIVRIGPGYVALQRMKRGEQPL
jgi:hypothetical protein